MEKINYLLFLITSSGALFLYYTLFLKNRSFNRFNRYYLLGNLVLPLFIPLIHFPVPAISQPVYPNNPLAYLPKLLSQPEEHSHINWITILLYASLGISLLLLIRFFLGLYQILQLRRACSIKRLDGYNLLEMKTNSEPFSFLKDIYCAENSHLAGEDYQRVINHEICHIREGHTYDKLLGQLLLCVFWMNPFYYLLNRELSMVHEFIADREAFPERNPKIFAEILLKIHHQPRTIPFINSFFHSPIKRRITMIKNKNKSGLSQLGKAFSIPFALILILSFSLVKVEAVKVPMVSHMVGKIQPLLSNTNPDTIPLPPNPPPAPKKVNGSFRNIHVDVDPKNVRVKSGVSPPTRTSILNKDSLKQGEGNVHIIVMDTLQMKENSESSNKGAKILILDGKEIKEEEMKKLSPETIKEIHVYKGDEAVKLYGEQGRKGVIVITTKDPK